MHYKETVAEYLVFMMTARQSQISKTMRYHGKHLDTLDCVAFSCHREETEQSCGARHVFFYFSNTGRLPIVACCERDFLGERELCDILYELYVSKVRYNPFYGLALYNLVPSLADITVSCFASTLQQMQSNEAWPNTHLSHQHVNSTWPLLTGTRTLNITPDYNVLHIVTLPLHTFIENLSPAVTNQYG